MQIKQFTFDKDGQKEIIPVERWAWGVVYKDNTELHQFSEAPQLGGMGVFHQIGEVKQENVQLFVLYKPADRSKRIDILVPEGAKLIHKYRNYVFYANTPNQRRVKVYIFGYKLGQHSHYNFILPDDRVVQANTDNLQLTQFNI